MKTLLRFFTLFALSIPALQAQFANKWLSAGSFQNWYSAIGGECELCGFVRTQQDGWRWPGIYRFTDSQAAKGLWLGARDVSDGTDNYPIRVVHVGPRVKGSGEFFPVKFELIAKYPQPIVNVKSEFFEGITESETAMFPDRIDANQKADAMLYTEVNTLLGVTMIKKVHQFSNQHHDNYHVIEYEFKNTGNTDGDADIEVPNQTVTDFYALLQWRWAVAKESRYVIGNGTGWGMNTMIDTRGDGLKADATGTNFRAQFAWHGKFPEFTKYDNLGGPILPSALPATQISAADTLGRLAASQFIGALTVYADKSATDKTDDPTQPKTTTYLDSDGSFQSGNNAFNPLKMQEEYNIMKQGHQPRHAFTVEPTGDPGFKAPTGNPALISPGGWSAANGYGPYTLAPGQSVKFVVVEAAAGLSRAENVRLGKLFKKGLLTNAQKNEAVFSSRDSLFKTFNRAIANYNAGFNIPAAPQPPAEFSASSGADEIQLKWKAPLSGAPEKYEIYRSEGRADSTAIKIAELPGTALSYGDRSAIRGLDYFYNIVSVVNNTVTTGLTPTGPLKSSFYYTQTYNPVNLLKPGGRSWDELRIVPNPINLKANSSDFLFGDTKKDQILFVGIPGKCKIELYTELGELLDTLEHTDGSGDSKNYQLSSAKQSIVSGIYIVVFTVTEDITDSETGALLYAAGERQLRKFVVIR